MVPEPDQHDAAGGSGSSAAPPAPAGLPVGPAIPPLNVTGLVVAKADLLAALRIYVPQIADIAPLDGERYLLSLMPQESAE